jgi:hypothetical protein
MSYKLIRLEDGTLIEVEAQATDSEEIAHGAELIRGVTIDSIRPLLLRVTKPLVEVWQELNQDMAVDGAEVELGLGFEGEGNLFVTKAKGSANFTLRLRLSPKPPGSPDVAPDAS